MRFFVILLVLALFFLSPKLLRKLQFDLPVLAWKDYLLSKPWVSENSNSGFLILFFLPVLILILLVPMLEHVVFGLPFLAVSFLLLVFSIGRKNIIDQFDLYTEEWKAGRGKDYLDIIYSNNLDVANDKDVHLAARSGLIYRGFESVLCVLFWFLLTGLLVPLVYRLLHLLKDDRDPTKDENTEEREEINKRQEISMYTHNYLVKLISLIEFIPALLLGLALNFVADVKFKGLDVLKKYVFKLNSDTSLILHEASIDALSLKTVSELQALDLTDAQASSAFYQSVPEELDKLKKSFVRLLMFFLAISALFLIF